MPPEARLAFPLSLEGQISINYALVAASETDVVAQASVQRVVVMWFLSRSSARQMKKMTLRAHVFVARKNYFEVRSSSHDKWCAVRLGVI